MNDDSKQFFLILFFIISIIFLVAIICSTATRNSMRTDAIKNGVGRFVIVDEKTGKTKFEWITSTTNTMNTINKEK